MGNTTDEATRSRARRLIAQRVCAASAAVGAMLGMLLGGCNGGEKNPTDGAADAPQGTATSPGTGIASSAGTVTNTGRDTSTSVTTVTATGASTGPGTKTPATTDLSTAPATGTRTVTVTFTRAVSATLTTTGVLTAPITSTPTTTGISTGLTTGILTTTTRQTAPITVTNTGACTSTDDSPHYDPCTGKFTCGIAGGTPCPAANPVTCCVGSQQCVNGTCTTATATVTVTKTASCTWCGFVCCLAGEVCGCLTPTSDGCCLKTSPATSTWTATGTPTASVWVSVSGTMTFTGLYTNRPDTSSTTVTRTVTYTCTATGPTSTATGASTGPSSASSTSASTGTATVICTGWDYCFDGSSAPIPGCGAACGGINDDACPNARLACARRTTGMYDGPSGTCVAAAAVKCSTAATCAGLPIRSVPMESGDLSWACNAGSCYAGRY